MSNLEPLITDRTAQDVAQRTQKAFYNVSDIDRINSYIEYLSGVLGLNLEVTELSLGEALTRTIFDDILSNVNALRAVWHVAEGTPETPIAVNWDWQKANDLEKILFSLNEFWNSKTRDKIYSGAFRAGTHIKFRG